MIRAYQNNCADSILNEFERGIMSTVAVLATGAGKTVIASEIIRRVQPARCALLCHRDTLAFQARDTIQRFAGVSVGIEMAELKADRSVFSKEQVIIGTVQTMNARNRMADFNAHHFDYLFADEFHHFVAPSFRKVLDYFRQNPRLKIIGLTATPDRSDEQALSKICETVAFKYDILECTADGWLCPIEQHLVKVEGLDYSHIKTTAGDLNLGQLSEVMRSEEIVHRMMQPTLEAAFNLPPRRLDFADVSDWGAVLTRHGRPARTLVFCASVAQAQRFAETMNRVKPGMATAVWDKVPKQERRQILKDFSTGQLQCLVNVGICSEGFDMPEVELVIMGRATKSRSLYTQFVGRCLRPLAGVVDNPASVQERLQAIANSAKPCAKIMDFVGNCGRHKLITTADILGGDISERAVELAKKKALNADRGMRMTDLLELSEEEIRKRIDRAKRESESRRLKVVARSRFNLIKVDPFDALDLMPAQPKSFDTGKKLSEKQVSLMARFGIDSSKYPYTQAKQLFIELCKRLHDRKATPRQADVLKRAGYENASELPAKEAKRLIDNLRNNGWQRPVIKPEIPDLI